MFLIFVSLENGALYYFVVLFYKLSRLARIYTVFHLTSAVLPRCSCIMNDIFNEIKSMILNTKLAWAFLSFSLSRAQGLHGKLNSFLIGNINNNVKSFVALTGRMLCHVLTV